MKFNTKKTGMPDNDDMIKDLEYFEEEKNKTYKVVEMSPMRYVEICANRLRMNFGQLLESRLSNTERMEYIMETTPNDGGWNMISLDFTRGFTQEGLHRAIVADKKGLTKIPVMVIFPKRPNEKVWY